MDKSALFALAGRGCGTVEIKGKEVECKALDLDARFSLSSQKDMTASERFEWLAACGCSALDGYTPQEVRANLDPEAIAKIAAKVMELSGMGADSEAEAEKN